MKKLSKKKLLAFLATLPLPEGATAPRASFEVYGRDVHGYIETPKHLERAAFERLLTAAGFACSPTYSPGSRAVSVTNISYFKGQGWDE